MVIVTVTMSLKEADKKSFVEHMKKLIKQVHQEKGCLRYELYPDLNHDTKFFLFEKWETQEALKKHLAQPHVKEHFQITAPWFDEPALLDLYDATAMDKSILTPAKK